MNIKDLIKKDQDKKQYRYTGRKYYKYNPQNHNNEITSFYNGQIYTTKVDKMLYTNYFRLLINQKINYLLAKEPEIILGYLENLNILKQIMILLQL